MKSKFMIFLTIFLIISSGRTGLAQDDEEVSNPDEKTSIFYFSKRTVTTD